MNSREIRLVGELFHALTLAQEPQKSYEQIAELLLHLTGASLGHLGPMRQLRQVKVANTVGARVSLPQHLSRSDHQSLEFSYNDIMTPEICVLLATYMESHTGVIFDPQHECLFKWYSKNLPLSEWRDKWEIHGCASYGCATPGLHGIGISTRRRGGFKKHELDLLRHLMPHVGRGLNNLDHWAFKLNVLAEIGNQTADPISAFQNGSLVQVTQGAAAILGLRERGTLSNPWLTECVAALKALQKNDPGAVEGAPAKPGHLKGADGHTYLLGARLIRKPAQKDLWLVRFEACLPARPDFNAARRRGLELGLSARQAEVLAWLSEGLSNKEIAQRVGISRFTVRAHLQAVFEKLNVDSRMAARDKLLDGR